MRKTNLKSKKGKSSDNESVVDDSNENGEEDASRGSISGDEEDKPELKKKHTRKSGNVHGKEDDAFMREDKSNGNSTVAEKKPISPKKGGSLLGKRGKGAKEKEVKEIPQDEEYEWSSHKNLRYRKCEFRMSCAQPLDRKVPSATPGSIASSVDVWMGWLGPAVLAVLCRWSTRMEGLDILDDLGVLDSGHLSATCGARGELIIPNPVEQGDNVIMKAKQLTWALWALQDAMKKSILAVKGDTKAGNRPWNDRLQSLRAREELQRELWGVPFKIASGELRPPAMITTLSKND
uniref:Uncharacterized protein n=1 Tax=Timema bartmani TaxID=61472 RepID=A0A7R9EXN6_9NEOP|nr:unnamed protein product [Timema bartmani]